MLKISPTKIQDWYKNKKILVLGGAGFIGSHIVNTLSELSSEVTVIDGFFPETGADKANFSQNSLQNCTFIDKEISEVADLEKILSSADLIIDCMALTAHHFGMKNPFLDLKLNTSSHLHVIQSLLRIDAKNKKVIYLGSRGQYGAVRSAHIDEETEQVPIDAQGINKLSAEHFYRIYAKSAGFSVVSLRVTNCYGPNQKVTGQDLGLIGSFIADLNAGKTVEIYGDAERTKNILFVKDLVEILLSVGPNEPMGFSAYNVAGMNIAIAKILDILIGHIGRGSYVTKEFPEHIKKIDVGEALFSDQKIRQWLGDFQLTDINVALGQTVEYFNRKSMEK